MPDDYQILLEAAIDHVQGMKERGVRYVNASHDLLTAPEARRTSPRQAPSSLPNVIPAPLKSLPSPIAPAPEPTSVAPIQPASCEQAFATGEQASRITRLAEIRKRALECIRCPHLAASRTQVVFGVGNPAATLMFVGEAPGMDEDAQGEPFVGKAGQLLTKIIETMGLTRDSVYIANIVKCRPDTPGQTAGNRKPTPEEMKACIPYLHEQIDVVKPKVMVALGGTAMEGLLGQTGISKLRGKWADYRGIPLMPTFHPAFVLHNRGDALLSKRQLWEDMLEVMARLELPISEKQKGYFRKSAG